MEMENEKKEIQKLFDAPISEDDINKIEQIREGINIEDSNYVAQFGAGVQSDVANFSDSILNEVRAKDVGYVGEIMTELMLKVKDLDAGNLAANNDGGFFSKLPFFNSMEKAVKKFIGKYQKMSVQIESIINNLEKAKMQLMKDTVMLDKVYEKNLDYMTNLNFYIAAGELKLDELEEKIIPELKAKADETADPMDVQRLNDATQFLSRFEKRVHDLKLSKTISIQTAPQIRLIQNNNHLLVEKIQSSLLNTIPLWKNQIVIAISIFRQKEALELQKQVSQTTNDLLRKNSEMLKQNTVETARESERGIVELETLKKVNDDLITTIDEVLTIQKEGHQQRMKAERELETIEKELKDKLSEVRK
jgi:uncharacterized protein YaaN involved in tellurite resistance